MKKSLVIFSLGTFAAAAAAIGSAQFNVEPAEKVKDGTWTDAGGHRVTIVGVCSVDPSTVSCWDVHGQNSQKTTDWLRAGLTNTQYYQDPSFRFGKKNRYFIYEVGAQMYQPQFLTADGNGIQTNNFNGGDNLRGWGRITTELDATSTDLYAQVNNLPGPAAVDVPFVEGSKVTYDGITITLGGWKAGGVQQPQVLSGGFGGGSRNIAMDRNSGGWRLFFGMDSHVQYFSITALDKDGQVIGHVDPKGRPISDLEFIKHAPQNNGYYPQPTTGQYAVAQLAPWYNQNAPQAGVYTSNVDPKYIGSLRFYTTTQKKIVFKDLPLQATTRLRD